MVLFHRSLAWGATFLKKDVWGLWVGLISLLAILEPGLAQEINRDARASIHPSIVTLEPGQRQKFKIIRMATPLNSARVATGVDWSVNNIPGGDPEIGTIDSDGVYRAPELIPSPHEIHITGEVAGVANSKLFATVIMAPDKPFYRMVGEYTEPIGKAEHLEDPHCVCLDKDGNLLIADYNGSRVLRFTPRGEYLGALGLGTGQGAGYVYKPRVVLTDKNGDIFVSDQKRFGPRVQVFTHEGRFLRSFAAKGNGPGEILRAHGMGFDSQDRLFTVDVDNMRVNVYTHEGEFVKSWGQDGPQRADFNAPHGLVIDANDDVFVSSYYGTIQKFDAEGRYLKTVTEADPPDGSVYIHSISGDRWGNVYAMVRGQRGYGGRVEVTRGKVVSLEKFNNNGDFIAGISLTVKAHSENWVFVDENDRLYFIYKSNENMGFEIFAPQ